MRLRRPTLVSAPLFVVGLTGSSFAIALGLWAAWHPESLGSPFWIPLVVSLFLGVGAFAGMKGCFVEVRGDFIVDVVAWLRIQRIPRSEIASIRVRSGFWRFYELTMDGGAVKVLLGATPAQFPARLLADAAGQDLADIELMLG